MTLSSSSSSVSLGHYGYIAAPGVITVRRKVVVHHPFRRPRVTYPRKFDVRCNDFSSQRSCVKSELSEPPGSRKFVTHRQEEAKHNFDQSHNNGVSHSGSSTRNPVVSDETVVSENQAFLDTDEPVAEGKEDGAVDVNLFGLPVSIPARWLLFSVPFMWGSFGPAVRLLFSQQPHLDPSVFNTARLLMSSAVYLPILLTEITMFKNSRSSSQKGDAESGVDEDRYSFVKAGIELGIYVFLANVAQVLGLQQVSAARAAFLVQLQTVIVPVLSGVFGLEVVSRSTLISSAIAVAGVALLSLDKGHGTTSSLSGDTLELVSAFFFSAYIIRLGRYCNNVRSSPLVATKILVQAVLSSAWAFGIAAMSASHSGVTTAITDSPMPDWTLPVLVLNVGVIAWTGLVSSAASGWAQTKGQQKVPASDAVVIFATQPLWASAIAAVLLGESLGLRGVVGGGLIVASTVVASFKSAGDGREVTATSSVENES